MKTPLIKPAFIVYTNFVYTLSVGQFTLTILKIDEYSDSCVGASLLKPMKLFEISTTLPI